MMACFYIHGVWCFTSVDVHKNLHQFRTFYRPRSRGDNTFGSVRVCACECVSICLSVGALLFEPFDLNFWHEGRS